MGYYIRLLLFARMDKIKIFVHFARWVVTTAGAWLGMK
jgi:hypothetical protein